MKRKHTPSNNGKVRDPVNWNVLEEEIQAYREELNNDVMGRMFFRTSLDGDGWDPMPIINSNLPSIEQAILAGRPEEALRVTAYTVVALCARVEVMAKAIRAAKAALSADVAQKELKRRDGKQRDTIGRKLDANRKAQTCCDLFAEYTPADVKRRGKKTVYKEVGEVAATRLELPEPIAVETERGYLRTKKTGGG